MHRLSNQEGRRDEYQHQQADARRHDNGARQPTFENVESQGEQSHHRSALERGPERGPTSQYHAEQAQAVASNNSISGPPVLRQRLHAKHLSGLEIQKSQQRLSRLAKGDEHQSNTTSPLKAHELDLFKDNEFRKMRTNIQDGTATDVVDGTRTNPDNYRSSALQ